MHLAHAIRQYAIAREKLRAVRRPHPMAYKRQRYARDCVWWRAYVRELRSRVYGTMHTQGGSYSTFANSREAVLAYFTRHVQTWHGQDAQLCRLGTQPAGQPENGETFSIYPCNRRRYIPRVMIVWGKA